LIDRERADHSVERDPESVLALEGVFCVVVKPELVGEREQHPAADVLHHLAPANSRGRHRRDLRAVFGRRRVLVVGIHFARRGLDELVRRWLRKQQQLSIARWRRDVFRRGDLRSNRVTPRHQINSRAP
jgi:hypothetical protein